MKRWILILAGLVLALAASAQETILDRLKAANTFDTMQLSFVQTRHSALLTKDLLSERVRLQRRTGHRRPPFPDAYGEGLHRNHPGGRGPHR